MDSGDAECSPWCAMLWVDNAADLAAMIWAGCSLAATIRQHSDGTQWTKYCGGNVGKLEPSDLPGWIIFWVDGEGENELLTLNQLGYRSAGTLRFFEIREVADKEPSCEAATGETLDAAATEEVLNANAVAPGMTLHKEVHNDGWPAPEESDDTTAGCEMMSCVTFTSETCCGSCSIM